ncbi:MAG: endolytic transglycosylase MltG [bacterium]|nr:endolytic transglycosylase MltG [bacterium]
MKSNSAPLRFLAFIFAVFVLGFGSFLWWNDAISPQDRTSKEPQLFVIERGEGIRNIAGRLSQQGLIRSPTSFYILVKLLGIETEIEAGVFRLNKAMNTRELALQLTHGTLDVWVTIPEGWRIEEVATKLAKELNIPEREFLKYAREGYMFPDTYLFPRDASASAVAQIFIDTFNEKVTTEFRSDSKKTGLTFDEVVALASIIEREGKTDADRPMIAGVLYNRISKDWPLQADATLQYAVGYQGIEKTWWKRELAEADKAYDSQFNTYLHTGLPPGAIASPGISAIRAAIYPVRSEYMYYLHDRSGGVHFAKTLDEHNANISAYLSD